MGCGLSWHPLNVNDGSFGLSFADPFCSHHVSIAPCVLCLQVGCITSRLLLCGELLDFVQCVTDALLMFSFQVLMAFGHAKGVACLSIIGWHPRVSTSSQASRMSAFDIFLVVSVACALFLITVHYGVRVISSLLR
jgi:hypothetical protein